MNQCTRILVVSFLFQGLASAATPSTNPVKSNPIEKDGVSVQVLPKQPADPSDEQPRFVVRFTNTAADYINLYDVEAVWDWQFQFTNTDKQAVHPGPWRLRMDSMPFRYPIAHKQIKPTESLDVSVNLNDPPFTFDFVYEGPVDKPLAPVRRLAPGTYDLKITITLKNPFGPGYHLWVGPLTTNPARLEILPEKEPHPTAKELAGYDDAIYQVTKKFGTGGLWMNGVAPEIKLPADAKPQDVIAAAVNRHSLESKAYRILRIQQFHDPRNMSAAVVLVGKKARVVVFFPFEESGWWTRFYDADVPSP